ncbi:DeoR/GlpR family DNA-binding transcription regulator [Ancylobacter radicis]|uniref:DeoR/GlpR transcriptional regulator n=1 Tax=Ancylobacter radicis TaxID=2836179 RepID=A0ABS5R7R0_9HYPH|nr:DeoR/GlpR family DNA-binding transcription regulator [Ancylobacter radicis]MBS9477694.1 DeoR/GlpR transcriptional regulator [Ancylobacter radicis]
MSRRRSDLLQAVRASGSCSVTELALRLGVSTETIRRHLQPLIEEGTLLRFHGGVMLPERAEEPPFQRRMQVNREAKLRIAQLVKDRVEDGDSLFLDNGTTTAYVADALAARSRLTIVTHSAHIAYRLASRNGNRVFMAGGELGGEDAAAFGASAIAFISQFKLRYALLSVGAITRAGELADFHLFEAEFSRAAMAQAEETWVIADHSKFGREASVTVCPLAAVDAVLTDSAPPEAFAAQCLEAGVAIVTPADQHA